MSQRPERARFAVKPAQKPAGSLDLILIGRLVLAAVLLVLGAFVVKNEVISIILLVLSAVASAYDMALEAFDSVLEKKYFATPILLLFVAFVSFFIGFGAEGAAMLLLYQLSLLVIAYVIKRTRGSAMQLLNGQDEEIQELPKTQTELGGEIDLENTTDADSETRVRLLQPGDVLCFYSSGSYIGHAGIYIGNNQFVHAANSRTGVIVSDLSGYYSSRGFEARRIVN